MPVAVDVGRPPGAYARGAVVSPCHGERPARQHIVGVPRQGASLAARRGVAVVAQRCPVAERVLQIRIAQRYGERVSVVSHIQQIGQCRRTDTVFVGKDDTAPDDVPHRRLNGPVVPRLVVFPVLPVVQRRIFRLHRQSDAQFPVSQFYRRLMHVAAQYAVLAVVHIHQSLRHRRQRPNGRCPFRRVPSVEAVESEEVVGVRRVRLLVVVGEQQKQLRREIQLILSAGIKGVAVARRVEVTVAEVRLHAVRVLAVAQIVL